MSERRGSALASCFLPLVALVVLGAIYLASVIANLPDRAAQKFGPPRPGLTDWQRFRYAAQLLWEEDALTLAPNPAGAEQLFRIEIGESAASILDRLAQQGLVTNPGALRIYLQYSGLDTTLQAGEYMLSPAMNAVQIAHALQDATPGEITFHIFAGWRMEEISAALPTSGLEISPKAFSSAASAHPSVYALPGEFPLSATLEGFLFPGEYVLSRDLSAPALIQILLDRFKEQVSGEIQDGFTQRGLTLHQAVTLAAIVQREAIIADEMPLIASVFYNRLAAGMTLGSDPTLQYALGYDENQGAWWKNPLSAEDLKVESLYNTYIYPGLPPGPISNPGLNALRAVAFPAQTPYYYFRTRCDGSRLHSFAETYAEHLGNACP